LAILLDAWIIWNRFYSLHFHTVFRYWIEIQCNNDTLYNLKGASIISHRRSTWNWQLTYLDFFVHVG
jgi:hypothetical protein